jgi:hypothetical protein
MKRSSPRVSAGSSPSSIVLEEVGHVRADAALGVSLARLAPGEAGEQLGSRRHARSSSFSGNEAGNEVGGVGKGHSAGRGRRQSTMLDALIGGDLLSQALARAKYHRR